MSTLTVPPNLSSPRDDAAKLYKAFKGFGCDTAAVINILAHRDSTQRALIEQEYKATYAETLEKRLISELTGKLETAVVMWMPDPATRDALILKKALDPNSSDFVAATDIICSRTPSQLHHLKQIFHSRFGTHIEQCMELFGSNDHLKLLLVYVRTQRYEGFEVDREMVLKDAKALYKAGEKKLGTDEKTFIHIFCERSRAHIAAVATAYHDLYGSSLKKAIKSETSGDFERGLLAILRCAQNPAKYFAKVLYNAMKGLGTNDNTLIRVIVTRTEIDMQYIKAEYRRKYKKSLNDAVESETSSHYRTFLLALLGPDHH